MGCSSVAQAGHFNFMMENESGRPKSPRHRRVASTNIALVRPHRLPLAPIDRLPLGLQSLLCRNASDTFSSV
jgi:hypothetical protein